MMAWSTSSGAESVAGSRFIFGRAKKVFKWLAWCCGVCLILTNIGVADQILQLDWDDALISWPSGSLNQSYTVGAGNVSITFNGSTDTPPGNTASLANNTPFISNNLTGGLSPAQNSLEIDVDYPGSASLRQIPIVIDFTHPGGVDNVSFSIFDLDSGGWTDVVQVTATTDGTTFFNPTSIVDSGANNSDGVNTVTGIASAVSTSADGTATFTFATSGIRQVRIIYSNVTTAFQWISLHDINFTAPAPVDLSISKSHVGSFTVGQVGTYTLSVSNDASATTELGPITVTDVLPAGLSFVSASGTGWTCSAAGQDVTCAHPGPLAPGDSLPNISLNVLPGASAVGSVVNSASVAGTAQDSNTSNNSASDPTTVDPAPSFTPQNKPLYLYSTPSNDLSRTPPTAAQPNVLMRKNVNPTETWNLNPITQANLVIDGGVANIPVVLVLSKRNTSSSYVNRSVQVTLSTSLGAIGTATQNLALNGTPAPFTFLVPIASNISLAAGSTISLRVANVTPGSGGRPIRVYPVGAGTNSRVELTSQTVINVDAIQFFDAQHPGGSAVTSFQVGSRAYIRAVVSDPFGSFDITSAAITIQDANSVAVISNDAMTQVVDSGVSTKTYEYGYDIGGTAPRGDWTATVNAIEGTEGIVSDTESATFRVVGPNIVFTKSSQVIDDGLGNTPPNAFAIPGATVQYTLNAINQGDGATDALTIEDPIPQNTSLCVADPCAQGAPPIQFDDAPAGTVASGLGLPVVVSYSNSAGPPYTYGYTPNPDSNGFDAAVTSIRIQPTGVFNPASGGTPAGFNILFRVQVR